MSIEGGSTKNTVRHSTDYCSPEGYPDAGIDGVGNIWVAGTSRSMTNKNPVICPDVIIGRGAALGCLYI